MRTARTIVPVVWALGCGPAVLGLLQLPGAAWCAMLGYHAGCLAAVRVAGGAGPRVPHSARAAIGVGAVSLLLVVGAGALAAELGLLPVGANRHWSAWGLRPPADLVWLAFYVIVNPWVEERFWRGALLASPLRASVGRNACRLLAIAGFGIHHAVVLVVSLGAAWGVPLVLPVVAAGALWTAMREKAGGIAPAVASHRGADLAVGVLYLWQWRP